MIQETILICQHFCHDCFLPIAQHQIRYTQLSIIDCCLVKHLLRKIHNFRFKLCQHYRLHLLIINNRITTLFQSSHLYWYFHTYQSMRIPKITLQSTQNMLPYILLWREANKPSPPRTKNRLLTVLSSYIHRLTP